MLQGSKTRKKEQSCLNRNQLSLTTDAKIPILFHSKNGGRDRVMLAAISPNE